MFRNTKNTLKILPILLKKHLCELCFFAPLREIACQAWIRIRTLRKDRRDCSEDGVGRQVPIEIVEETLIIIIADEGLGL